MRSAFDTRPMLDQRLQVALSDAEKEQLAKVASARGVTMGEFVRRAIRAAAANEEVAA